MNNEIPVIIKCLIDDITIEICHGNIPDIFRQLWFGPIKKFKLPDTKVVYQSMRFQRWLTLYRHASPDFEKQLLEVAKCN